MDRRSVDELGHAAFVTGIEPLKRERSLRAPVLGFDTEYTSKGQRLVSFQLASAERTAFVAARELTVDSLARECRKLVPHAATEVLLTAYFSIAELQHLPVLHESTTVRSFGTSVDVTFHSERWKLTLRVFDLARFFDRSPLSKVAESYGLAKLEGVDRTSVTLSSARSAHFREYAVHDAVLCYQIASKLRSGFARDGVDPLYEGSPASSAAAVFRRALSGRLAPPPARVRLCALLSTWGGRAEALERGNFARVTEWDLVSAYPNAAISLGTFPTARSWKRVENWRGFSGAVGGVGRFRFKFPDGERYPCLPVWTRACHVYPLRGETYCTLDEARLARSMGASLSIVEAYAYRTGDRTLSDYMKRVVTERRASTDVVRRTALKLQANSLIGKFAQRVVGPEIDAVLELARSLDIDLDGAVRLTREECIALGVPMRVRLGSMFFPEWNALITGRVRAMMGRAIAETEAVYASTDAVWSRSGKPPTPFLGGQWEVARKGPAVVARTRLARLGEHIAHHSIWTREAGAAILERVVNRNEAPMTYKVRRPIKLLESLAKGDHFGHWIEETRAAQASWDHKRELGPYRGSSARSFPWRSAAEYLASQKTHARHRRQAARSERDWDAR